MVSGWRGATPMLTATSNRVPFTTKGGLQGVQDALSDLDSGRGVRVAVDDDRELVTAQTGHQVLGTYTVCESGCELDEQDVSTLVPEGVVDVLEVVDVDEQQALLRRPTVTAGLECRGEAFVQCRAVGQPGQRVVGRAQRELVVVMGQRGGHRVERLGELAQLVTASDSDVMFVLTGLDPRYPLTTRSMPSRPAGWMVRRVTASCAASLGPGRRGLPPNRSARRRSPMTCPTSFVGRVAPARA